MNREVYEITTRGGARQSPMSSTLPLLALRQKSLVHVDNKSWPNPFKTPPWRDEVIYHQSNKNGGGNGVQIAILKDDNDIARVRKRAKEAKANEGEVRERLRECELELRRTVRDYQRGGAEARDVFDKLQIRNSVLKEENSAMKEQSEAVWAVRAAEVDALRKQILQLQEQKQELEKRVRDCEVQDATEQQRALQERIDELQSQLVTRVDTSDPPTVPNLPPTPDELKQLSRDDLETVAFKMMEDLRKARGDLTPEEKRIAQRTQQAKMSAYVEARFDEEKWTRLQKPENRDELDTLFSERDLSIALLPNEDLADLYRALMTVLIQAELTPEDLNVLGTVAEEFENDPEKAQGLAETLTIAMGDWLEKDTPGQRKSLVIAKNAAAAAAKERQAMKAEEEERRKKLQAEEDAKNKMVYETWRPFWKDMLLSNKYAANEQAVTMKRRWARNTYLPLLVAEDAFDTIMKDPDSYKKYWKYLSTDSLNTESEIRALIYLMQDLKRREIGRAKVPEFLTMLKERLKEKQGVLTLPPWALTPSASPPPASPPPMKPPPMAPPPMAPPPMAPPPMKQPPMAPSRPPAPSSPISPGKQSDPNAMMRAIEERRKKTDERNAAIARGEIIAVDPRKDREEELKAQKKAREEEVKAKKKNNTSKASSSSGGLPFLALKKP